MVLPLPTTPPPKRPSPLPCALSWLRSLFRCTPYDAPLDRQAVAAEVIAALGSSAPTFIYGPGYVGSAEGWPNNTSAHRMRGGLALYRRPGLLCALALSRPIGRRFGAYCCRLPTRCPPVWSHEASMSVSARETRSLGNLPSVSGGRARRRGSGGCLGRSRRAALLCRRS